MLHFFVEVDYSDLNLLLHTLLRPTPLRGKSCLSQSIGNPTEQFAALLRVNELLYPTSFKFSILLNNGEDHQTILGDLVTVGGMEHG